MSVQQEVAENRNNQELVVFQVDLHKKQKLNVAYAMTNQYGHLQITCIKIKLQSNIQPQSFTHLTSIESFWTKTYQSNNDLPKRLFQMKNFLKLMEYFKNQKQRIIQTQEKSKNDKRKLLFNLWVPVTKNITDFVPLQLELIEQDMVHYFFQAEKTVFDLVHKKILEILEQRNLKKKIQEEKRKLEEQKLAQEEQQRRKNESKQKQNQCQKTSFEEYLGAEDFQQGQMSSDIFYYSSSNCNHQIESSVMKNYRKQSEIHQQSQTQNDTNQIQHKTFYELCPESKQSLKKQYIKSLKQKNELLLERVFDLQFSIVKKNVQLQIYQDPNTDLQKIEQVIENKCESKIEKCYQAINSLMILFHDLKKTIPHKVDEKSKVKQLQKQLQESEITQKKDINQIFKEIENVFQQFY